MVRVVLRLFLCGGKLAMPCCINVKDGSLLLAVLRVASSVPAGTNSQLPGSVFAVRILARTPDAYP